jgi:hypothetical protein
VNLLHFPERLVFTPEECEEVQDDGPKVPFVYARDITQDIFRSRAACKALLAGVTAFANDYSVERDIEHLKHTGTWKRLEAAMVRRQTSPYGQNISVMDANPKYEPGPVVKYVDDQLHKVKLMLRPRAIMTNHDSTKLPEWTVERFSRQYELYCRHIVSESRREKWETTTFDEAQMHQETHPVLQTSFDTATRDFQENVVIRSGYSSEGRRHKWEVGSCTPSGARKTTSNNTIITQMVSEAVLTMFGRLVFIRLRNDGNADFLKKATQDIERGIQGVLIKYSGNPLHRCGYERSQILRSRDLAAVMVRALPYFNPVILSVDTDISAMDGSVSKAFNSFMSMCHANAGVYPLTEADRQASLECFRNCQEKPDTPIERFARAYARAHTIMGVGDDTRLTPVVPKGMDMDKLMNTVRMVWRVAGFDITGSITTLTHLKGKSICSSYAYPCHSISGGIKYVPAPMLGRVIARMGWGPSKTGTGFKARMAYMADKIECYAKNVFFVEPARIFLANMRSQIVVEASSVHRDSHFQADMPEDHDLLPADDLCAQFICATYNLTGEEYASLCIYLANVRMFTILNHPVLNKVMLIDYA